MVRDPRYDPLFEPLQIGPVTTKNRFYQVPHCTGMGRLRPNMVADVRASKAEGGWGVVCTEYCSIHPSFDDTPYPSHTLWNQGDINSHRLMTDKVHAHGALAGVELWASGSRSANLMTREVPMDVTSLPNWNGDPFQSRAMSKSDIKALRRWHRDAALRARTAGFDIVYVYATHHYLLDNFLNPAINTRTDEYGGSQENRMRLIRELIEETKEAVGNTCAVAVRFSVDEGGGADGTPVHADRMEIFEALAELPDLWDINISDYSLEMGVSRFVKEGALEPYLEGVKAKTTKPVVTVGRFTSPETMVSQIRRGVVDLIGAARPSIADPFLPNKIDEGRVDDIRECIGCNICYTGDSKHYPLRCTQNPTMGEEWRRGWHPEYIPTKGSSSHVLVVGAGPAGLEAARALGQRGYQVTLAEAKGEFGGRVSAECKLPGLSEWARVRDYRTHQLLQMANVDTYLHSKLSLANILEVGADHVVIATGAIWRTDACGRYRTTALSVSPPAECIFTPDDIMQGRLPQGTTIVYDDDGFYLGGVIAELLHSNGNRVIYITPDSKVSAWGVNNAEQIRTHRRLIELDISIILNHGLDGYDGENAILGCVYSDRQQAVTASNLVLVTSRTPVDTLYHEVQSVIESSPSSAPATVARIGDAEAPSIIAAAVYAGHRYARELDEPEPQPGYDVVSVY
ncbi:NADH:flavin oxidoreductase [Chromatiales bacterium (ex Bugula neritina AB1)]|nr:NADH:flavin oxidoreductase [Chromatiales bacterium (ex Bugula neritina AB1)]